MHDIKQSRCIFVKRLSLQKLYPDEECPLVLQDQ